MAERILLVQLADIGDMILTTPAITALRAALPNAHLAMLCASHTIPVLEEGLIDEFIPLKRKGFNQSRGLLNPQTLRQFRSLKDGNYDTVIFFHQFTLRLGTLKFWMIAKFSGATQILGLDNGKARFLTHSIPDEGFGAKHQAQYWLDLVGLLGADNSPHRAQVAFDRGILPLAAHRGIRIIIHAGGGDYSMARRWESDKFAQVADTLVAEFDAQIVLVGTENDDAAKVEAVMSKPVINLTGKTTLTQLADVIRSADLFIGTDSGVMHLAAAVRTPIVAIYGPSNPQAWGPWSPGGKVALISASATLLTL